MREDKIAATAFGCGCLTWVIAILINLAFWGAVIYVAIHFIGKFW